MHWIGAGEQRGAGRVLQFGLLAEGREGNICDVHNSSDPVAGFKEIFPPWQIRPTSFHMDTETNPFSARF